MGPFLSDMRALDPANEAIRFRRREGWPEIKSTTPKQTRTKFREESEYSEPPWIAHSTAPLGKAANCIFLR